MEKRPEHPAGFTEIEATDFNEKKRLHLEQSAEFGKQYEQVVEQNEGNSDKVMYLADDLLQYYNARLDEATEYEEGLDQEFSHLDQVAEAMTSLLREKQPSP